MISYKFNNQTLVQTVCMVFLYINKKYNVFDIRTKVWDINPLKTKRKQTKYRFMNNIGLLWKWENSISVLKNKRCWNDTRVFDNSVFFRIKDNFLLTKYLLIIWRINSIWVSKQETLSCHSVSLFRCDRPMILKHEIKG